jgi:hypothetical protein
LLVGLIAGIALILGPRLYDRDATARPPSGAPSGTRPSTVIGETGGGIPAAFDGTWRGTARNQDGVMFPAELTFETGQDTAQVSYSGEATCKTTLTLTAGTANRLELGLAEAPSCTPGNVTVQTRSDGALDYTFTSSSGTYTIQAALTRAG